MTDEQGRRGAVKQARQMIASLCNRVELMQGDSEYQDMVLAEARAAVEAMMDDVLECERNAFLLR